MKKIFTVLLCMIIVFSAVFTASADETTWNIENGVLTISGTGAMTDFKFKSDAPWYNEKATVEKIVVEEGVTHIGDLAFYGMTNAKSISLPSTIQSIGLNALSYTEGSVTNIANTNTPLTFSVTADRQVAKAGSDFYISIDLSTDLKNISEISGTLVFDSTRIFADENDIAAAENKSDIQLISNTVKISLSNDNSEFPLTVAKLKFKALENINDINITCFNLKNCKVTTLDAPETSVECSLIQLTSSTVLPLANIQMITNNSIAKEYAAANGIKLEIAQDDEITVIIDNEKVEFDVKPMLINDRTMVPMRAIFEKLGAFVQWDDETQTAFGTDGNILIAFQIDNTLMSKSRINGQNETITLDVPAQLINDRTLVPIRAISEAFECKVDWIDETQTVVITSAK